MKTLNILICGIFVSVFALSCFARVPELDAEWLLYKQEYRKLYTTEDEETERREIWEANLDYIKQHNEEFHRGEHSYTLGLNEFADMSHEEFQRLYVGGFKPSDSLSPDQNPDVAVDTSGLPSEVDWRTEGWVGPIGNENQCGGSWAFTATGALEGQVKNKTGKLIVLSVQQLMDCSGNQGCEGGFTVSGAFKYILDAGGIESNATYPYKEMPGQCKFNKSAVVAKIRDYKDVPKSEKSLMVAVATVGPISAMVDASHVSFQLYRSGVYDNPLCSSTRVDHSLLVVGYGSLNGKKYWIAKNSWGTSWGDKGYILLSKDKHNQCGIASTLSYPIM